MNKIVLDASAVLAVINQEEGHLNVEKHLQFSIISAVNYSEVVTVLSEIGMPVKDVETIMREIMIEIIPFDQELALTAATLRKDTKKFGLSLGDRACLALAKTRKLSVLTADKIWIKTDVGIDIRLIRD